MNLMFLFLFFPLPVLFQFLAGGCFDGGAVYGVGCGELSCGWLQMRQLARSDVLDGCVSLKYE